MFQFYRIYSLLEIQQKIPSFCLLRKELHSVMNIMVWWYSGSVVKTNF